MRRTRRAARDAPRLNQRDGQKTEQIEGGEKGGKRRGGGGGGGERAAQWQRRTPAPAGGGTTQTYPAVKDH